MAQSKARDEKDETVNIFVSSTRGHFVDKFDILSKKFFVYLNTYTNRVYKPWLPFSVVVKLPTSWLLSEFLQNLQVHKSILLKKLYIVYPLLKWCSFNRLLWYSWHLFWFKISYIYLCIYPFNSPFEKKLLFHFETIFSVFTIRYRKSSENGILNSFGRKTEATAPRDLLSYSSFFAKDQTPFINNHT